MLLFKIRNKSVITVSKSLTKILLMNKMKSVFLDNYMVA